LVQTKFIIYQTTLKKNNIISVHSVSYHWPIFVGEDVAMSINKANWLFADNGYISLVPSGNCYGSLQVLPSFYSSFEFFHISCLSILGPVGCSSRLH